VRLKKPPIGPLNPSDATVLDQIQQESFPYFLHESNPKNGLIRDKTKKDWPASITATGLGLASYPIGVERGLLSRHDAIKRTLAPLRFFSDSHQGTEADATGYRGFYYHFLNMETGRRAWECELSTIDSAFLLAGALAAAMYFDRDTPGEREVRERANALYQRVDWRWAQDRALTLRQGWTPETGFLKYRWQGYSEALLLYVLGLGSPTHPLASESYRAWRSTYKWKKIYGNEFLYGGPLFIHQYSHLWLDFRGIQDDFMRKKGIDYFENSRRATLVQQRYAIRNPRRFARYSERCWGITASDGPGPATARVDGIKRKFFDYVARGVPFGPDDGTVAPWAVVASLPFAPEIVLPTIRHLNELRLREGNPYSFRATFNPTYPHRGNRPYGWVTPWHFALSQGPIIMMIENYRTGLLWRLMQRCPYVVNGLRRAGFRGGWLSQA
jgi:hypothetical protein